MTATTHTLLRAEGFSCPSCVRKIEKALDALRSRFGSLKDVDRPAAQDDFVTMNLTATVDGEQVDQAEGLSYQVGAGTMLEGIDEALDGLSAGEDATFETTLNGGEHDGETAVVKLELTAVKERELPEADDEFAQLASEFDTIAELKEDLKKQAAEEAVNRQGVEARDKVLEELAKLVEVPVPDGVIAEQVEQHFSAGGHTAGDDHDTAEHRAELEQNTREAFANEVILDEVAEAEEAAEGDLAVATPVRSEPKIGRNEPCPCGSGKKYKHCHGQVQ